MKVFLVAGARPNFMKIAPIYRASLRCGGVDCRIVHTGQHYDHQMSQAFFDELEIPAPAHHLEAGSGSHAVQTSRIMVAFEQICEQERPDLVIVVGDVNSTLACSVVAKKAGIKVAHVEAGLRSFDLAMPEEINRMVTDAISDYFFVTEESGAANLLREGKPQSSIHFVGHVMIDNLLHQVKKLESRDPASYPVFRMLMGCADAAGAGTGTGTGPDDRQSATGVQPANDLPPVAPSSGRNLAKNGYGFMTLHRPSNVDNRGTFLAIAAALNEIALELPIIFPVHPRTRKMMEQFDVRLSPDIIMISPLGFMESLLLWKDAKLVLTDSGGLQEETSALGVPCVTIRENTERPITVELGTNVLAGTTREGILDAYRQCFIKAKTATVPPLWDGKASERIWDILTR